MVVVNETDRLCCLYEHVKLYYCIQSDGIMVLHMNTRLQIQQIKNMSLFCIDVIATLIKVAAILKTQPVTGILYLSYLASLNLNIDIDTNIKFQSPLFAKIWDIENSWWPF